MAPNADKQWRIENAQALTGVRLKFQAYSRWSDAWDHDHCAACSATFKEGGGREFLTEGYATCDDYRLGARYEWVCSNCFVDLRTDMQWVLADD